MSETLEQRIIATWKASPDIREEFMGDFQAYVAWNEADAEGRVRIQGQGKKQD